MLIQITLNEVEVLNLIFPIIIFIEVKLSKKYVAGYINAWIYPEEILKVK